MVIDMLHTCNIKVKGNLISEINKCHLVRQKFFLLCFIFFFIFFLLIWHSIAKNCKYVLSLAREIFFLRFYTCILRDNFVNIILHRVNFRSLLQLI